jgi:ribosomal protein S18 acetylase RimI-like enzyme
VQDRDLVAGQVLLRRNWNHYGYVQDIAVDVRFRRRGIGRMLLSQGIEWARSKHLPGMMLKTQDNNVAACRFYESLGFQHGGFDQLLYKA